MVISFVIVTIDLYSQQFIVGNVSYSIINPTEKTAMVGWQQQISNGWQYSPCIDTSTEGEIVIPQTVNYQGNDYIITQVAMGAFSDCINITSVKLPTTVKSIGKKAFYNCSKLADVDIPSGVDSIGTEAFGSCKCLTEIRLSSSLSVIESSVFSNSGLVKIHIPESIISIGSYAFSRCPLKIVEIPRNVTNIESSAFQYCSSLETIVLGENVNSIGGSAFGDCYQLKRVFCKSANPQGCSQYAFNRVSTSNVALYVPVGSLSQYTNVTWSGWSGFSNIEEKNAPIFADIIMGATRIEAEFLLVDPAKKNVQIGSETCSSISLDFSGKLVIPTTITDYYGNTFSVKAIGLKAFENCRKLTELLIPSSINNICKAFIGCEELKTVIVDNRNPSNIIEGEEDTFEGISHDAVLYIPAGTKERYERYNMWTAFSQILESSPISIGDISTRCDSKATMPVYLRSTELIAGIQFNISLPKGVSIVEENGCPLVSTSERTAGMTAMGRKDPDSDNKYMFVLLSLKGEPITGTEGAIMNIRLNVDKNVDIGIYDIKIEDIIMVTYSFDTLTPTESTSELTVTDIMLGDVNNDGIINVTDAIGVVNYILKNTPSSFVEGAADVNQDGIINITDAIGIVNMIFGNGALSRMMRDYTIEPQ